MASSLVNGALIAIAGTYGTASAISAITNASPAVATLAAAHGVVVGDQIEVTSGWQGIDGRVVRVSAVSTNDVTLEGVDTTDLLKYPAGTGTGSAREITAWQNIPQILDPKSSGGTQQFLTYQFLNQDRQTKVPTFQDAVDITLLTHDDPSLPHHAIIMAAQAVGSLRGFRIVMRDGKKYFGNGYWSIQQVPEFNINDMVKRTITLAVVGDISSYLS